MATSEKWVVSNGYLRNFNEYLKVFNLETCNEVSLNKNQVDKIEMIGSYVISSDKIFAVYNCNDELRLVMNNSFYYLSNAKHSLHVDDVSSEKRIFRLVENWRTIDEFEYTRQQFIDFDPWSDEDDVDFFAWITKMYNQDKLLTLYKK